MKTVCEIMILVLSVSAGTYLKKRMIKREKSLEKCILLIDTFYTRINYSHTETEEIISSFADTYELELARLFKVSESVDLRERWAKAVKESSFSDCLKKSDSEILLSFGNLLGSTDFDGQKNNCFVHREMINKNLEEARNDNTKKGKLALSLPVLCGIGVFIIMM